MVGAPARAHRKGCESPTYSGVLPTHEAVQFRPLPPLPSRAPPARTPPLVQSVPPCRCPPFSPPPPHPPRASPAIVVCGGEGGALTGGAVLVRCSWAGGRGALWSLWSLLVEPTQPAATCRPGATGRTDCRAPSSRPHSLSAGRATRPIRTVQRAAGGDRRKPKQRTPPRASGRVRRGRLTRSPLFPLCIALPQLLHSPMVAPRLRLGAGLCAGGAAQAPQQVKPEKKTRLPKRLPRK